MRTYVQCPDAKMKYIICIHIKTHKKYTHIDLNNTVNKLYI